MIKEDYVSFEVAKLLKEKGFNELCFRLIMEDGEYIEKSSQAWNGLTKKQRAEFYLCPTHQMAMAWLRETHNIFIEISTSIDLNGNYHFSYTILDKECKYVRRGYTDFDWKYEEAVEAALKYSLENLI